MIRPAAASDIPYLLEMGGNFHKASGLKKYIAFDDVSFLKTITHLIKQGDLFVLGDEPVGMAALLVLPSYYNQNALVAGEIFWWVEPGYRGEGWKLAEALQERAIEKGATLFHMSSMEALRAKAVGRLYEREGFELMDHTYYKAIG